MQPEPTPYDPIMRLAVRCEMLAAEIRHAKLMVRSREVGALTKELTETRHAQLRAEMAVRKHAV